MQESPKLVGPKLPDFVLGRGPLKTTIFETFIQEQKTVFFPEQALKTIFATATE
jgi:hypothetical protein